MKSKLIERNSRKYLEVTLAEITQKEQSFYLAKIKASDFLEVYTVRPAQYDLEKHISLANSFINEDEYYQHLITEDRKNIQEKDFQRDPNNDRIKKIVSYLETEEYALFPNTIICNCDLINDWKDYNIDENSDESLFFSLQDKPEFLSFLKKQNDQFILYIPYLENAILVIDGQHRLVGLQKMGLDFNRQYDLVIAFLIGFDRSIIAKQFYTINYEQKPVNKSLLYQLSGEFTREINELSFMHNVVKLLNEIDKSPFQGRIKMLGKTPKDMSDIQKNQLSISQAFLIDSTIRFISAKAKGSFYAPIFLKYFKEPKDHVHIIKVLARYFNAVKEIKNDWDWPSKSIISKGIGVTGLLKILNLIFPVIFKENMKNKWDNIDVVTIELFKKNLEGLEKVDFSSEGVYGKAGSAGVILKIKDDILSHLKIFEDINLNFENQYRDIYLNNFNNELEKLPKTAQ